MEKIRQLRHFGVMIAFIPALIWLWQRDELDNSAIVVLGLLTILLSLITIFRPRWLESSLVYWLKFGLIASRVVNPLILRILYFLVVTPFGLISRMSKQSYQRNNGSWVKRGNQPGFDHQ